MAAITPTPKPVNQDALMHAIGLGDLPEVRRVLDGGGIDLEWQDRFEGTPLYYASKKDQPEILSELLARDAKPNSTLDQHTPLHIAPSAEIVNRLLAAKADPNLQEQFGETPLHKAIAKTPDIVRALLNDPRTDPTIANRHGESPLEGSIKNLVKNPDPANVRLLMVDDRIEFFDGATLKISKVGIRVIKLMRQHYHAFYLPPETKMRIAECFPFLLQRIEEQQRQHCDPAVIFVWEQCNNPVRSIGVLPKDIIKIIGKAYTRPLNIPPIETPPRDPEEPLGGDAGAGAGAGAAGKRPADDEPGGPRAPKRPR